MSRVLPILFNTEMVRAILEDRKNDTRRCIKPQPIHKGTFWELGDFKWPDHVSIVRPSPYTDVWDRIPYHEGDILYVRETWCNANKEDAEPDYYYYADTSICEDYDRAEWKWRPSIHMPKAAARIWLKVTDVRIERLNEMTLEDFLKEGVMIRPEAFNDPENAYQQAKSIFIDIWDPTIKKSDRDRYGWEANPWTWVTEFEWCEKPKEER